MSYGNRVVSKENILSKVSEYDIFKAYISNFKEIGTLFRSELRKDNNPSCKIYLSGKKLNYFDFSTGDSLNCFNYIMKRYAVDFIGALCMINRDFCLGFNNLNSGSLPTAPNINPKTYNLKDEDLEEYKVPVTLKVYRRKWEKIDGTYWKDKYGIGVKILKKFNIFPVKSLTMHSRKGFKNINRDKICYGYYFGKLSDGRDSWKIYQPLAKNKKQKWLSNVTSETLQGFDQLPRLGERLIITKSLKDVMVLHKLGIPAIAPHGEAMRIPQEVIQGLRNRFSQIVFLYDNDEAGEKAAKKLESIHHIKAIFLPKDTEKDPSDFVEKFGYDKLKTFLNNINYSYEQELESSNP